MIQVDIENIKLKSLANLPVVVSGIPIYPVKIRDIIELGYDVYSQYLSLMMLSKDQLIHKDYINTIPDELGIYDMIEMFGESANIHSLYYSGLKFIIGSSNIFYTDSLYINHQK
ncbi:hypothetical protein HMSSN036_03540 [Paenibacillus macerans]|nr:hypothetical protein HMSSN036_03540 [Paenibacillus macerans]